MQISIVHRSTRKSSFKFSKTCIKDLHKRSMKIIIPFCSAYCVLVGSIAPSTLDCCDMKHLCMMGEGLLLLLKEGKVMLLEAMLIACTLLDVTYLTKAKEHLFTFGSLTFQRSQQYVKAIRPTSCLVLKKN